MKRTFLGSALSVLLLGFTVQAIAEPNLENKDLKGDYIYSFSGPTSGGNISEIGVFTADGDGNLTAVALTSLGGVVIAGPNELVWDCEYNVASNGFVDITCDRLVPAVEGIEWSMVIDHKKKQVRFQASGNQPGFGNVDIQGSGTRQ